MPITHQGFGVGTAGEVDTGTRAVRAVERPQDYSRFTSNRRSSVLATIAGNQAANGAYLTMLYGGDGLALVRQVSIGIGGITAFTAGAFTVQLFFCRQVSAAATGGTTVQQGLTNPNDGKLRSRMRHDDFGGISLNTAAQFMVGNAALMTFAPTGIDANPLSSLTSGALGAGQQEIFSNGTKLWNAKPGEHPIVLGMQDGIVLKATPPTIGTWSLNINARWDEVPAY